MIEIKLHLHSEEKYFDESVSVIISLPEVPQVGDEICLCEVTINEILYMLNNHSEKSLYHMHASNNWEYEMDQITDDELEFDSFFSYVRARKFTQDLNVIQIELGYYPEEH